jgi:hypothetical protein
MLQVAVACPREKRTLFSWMLESSALQSFFGHAKGSYLGKNQLLSAQMADLLEIDYAADGEPISEMPSLGDGTHLDVGGEYHSIHPNDGGALILSPCGKIQAAAIYWQQSNLPSGYGTGPVFLTIFLKKNLESHRIKKQINILEHFGELENQVRYIGAIQFQRAVHSADQWSTDTINITIPTNVVYLDGQ